MDITSIVFCHELPQLLYDFVHKKINESEKKKES